MHDLNIMFIVPMLRNRHRLNSKHECNTLSYIIYAFFPVATHGQYTSSIITCNELQNIRLKRSSFVFYMCPHGGGGELRYPPASSGGDERGGGELRGPLVSTVKQG